MTLNSFDIPFFSNYLHHLMTSNNQIHQKNSQRKCVLALSGGADSVALFHLLRLSEISFEAIHINHQISPNALIWENFCQNLCDQYDISLEIMKVDCTRQGGESLEDIARRRRYAIFSKLDCDILFMAHHQDDQIETLLTQLFRGTGLNGLLGMPDIKHLTDSIQIIRPLLNYSKHELKHFLNQFQFEHIEDESNQDVHYARNFWRNQILPQLEIFYPNYRKTIQRTQRHLQETFQLNQEIIQSDLKLCLDDSQQKINLDQFSKLNSLKQKAIFREYLHQQHLKMPTESRLNEMLKQLLTATDNAIVTIQHDQHEIRRFKNEAYIHRISKIDTNIKLIPNFIQSQVIDLSLFGFNLKIKCVEYPANSAVDIPIHLRLKSDLIQSTDRVEIKLRQGGERFSFAKNRPKRSLKQQYQTLNIPVSERETMPLFYVNDQLFYIPALGIEAYFQPDDLKQRFFAIIQT